MRGAAHCVAKKGASSLFYDSLLQLGPLAANKDLPQHASFPASDGLGSGVLFFPSSRDWTRAREGLEAEGVGAIARSAKDSIAAAIYVESGVGLPAPKKA